MSFSFGAKAANKAAMVETVKAEMDKVVTQQSIHERDRDVVEATVAAMLDVLPDDDTKDLTASVSGSLSWDTDAAQNVTITGANVSVYVGTVAKEQPA